MRASRSPFVLAGVLCGLGTLILLSILLHLTGHADPLAWPGRFLFSRFLWASFFVPAYLLILALFLITPSRAGRGLFHLSLMNVPFLTLSLFFQVLFLSPDSASGPAAWTLNSFGRFPGSMSLLILTTLEILIILRIGQALPARATPQMQTGQRAKTRPAPEARPASRVRPAPVVRAAGRVRPAGEPRPSPKQAPARPAAPARAVRSLPRAGRAAEVAGLLPAPEAEEVIEAEVLSMDSTPPEPRPSRAGRRTAREVVPAPASVRVHDGGPSPGRPAAPAAPPAPARVSKDGPASGGAPTAGGASTPRAGGYDVPVQGLLRDYADGEYWRVDEETRQAGDVLRATLEEFKIQAEVTGIRKGPVITMFEILPAPGVKISRIVNLADNIALRLAASRVRIVAPIPGKHAVGIEVPNRHRAIVSFKEIVELEAFRKHPGGIPVVLGKDISGEPQIVDLAQTPHLLIAGATGSGKSVCVNSLICSILYTRSPEEVRFLLVDPKIVELKFYNDIPHLLTPVITEPKKTFQALQYCLSEMERRYHLLDALGVRDIRSYNKKVVKARVTADRLPYLVLVIDEFADLIAATGKEMESAVARLAAMSRAVGIHLVLATQRPSIEVITGLIKANIPSRIAFMVASKFDSRIIIDAVGAEKLLGQGDMLFSPAWNPIPTRIQGAFLSEEEVEAITHYMKSLGKPEYIDDEIFLEEEEMDLAGDGNGVDDPLMEKALEIVMAKGNASASYLQRRLKIGYNRAARLVEIMEMRGIVGPANGSKPREILHVPDR